jgi:hypothetical protein
MMVVKKRSWSSIPAAVTLVVLAGSANAADESVKKVALCTPCHGETGISQTENTHVTGGATRSLLAVAIGLLPQRLPEERDHAADGRTTQQ